MTIEVPRRRNWARPSRIRGSFAFVLAFWATTAWGQDVPLTETTESPAPTPPSLLVLPFANYTQRTDAVSVVMPHVYRRLRELGISHLSETEIRPLLRKYRIRSVGRIGGAACIDLREETGAPAIVVGSLDFYEDVRQLEVGLSLRIVDSQSFTLLAAGSNAGTGRDYERFFGLGRIESIDALAERVVNDLLDGLELPARLAGRAEPAEPPGPCPRVAIVNFDNRSEYAYGGDVFGNILLSALVAENYVVLEPGAVHEHFLNNQVMLRGEIDLPTLASLTETFDLCYLITGVVEHYDLAQGMAETSHPELAFGARLLDAQRATLVATTNADMNGGDSIMLLDMGRRRALGRLSMRAVRDIVDRLDDEQRKRAKEGR